MLGSQPLYALVYVSQACWPMSQEDLEALLHDSRDHNETVGITGFLIYERAVGDGPAGSFVQYIEGSRQAVLDVFHERIETASQHRDIQVQRQGPVRERSFPDWTMAFERTSEGALKGFSDLVNKLGPPRRSA